MKVTYRTSAEVGYLAFPKEIQREFRDAIRLLARDPTGRLGNLDVEPIRGAKNLFRLKISNYRGIFRAEEDRLVFLDFGYGHDPYLKFGWP
jgi:mRNA-degrading endonuclease RelE of RelBE toxin-antitoxin system